MEGSGGWPPEMAPEPAAMLALAELKSDATGGCSGLGRPAARSLMTSCLFWLAWSTTDWGFC